MNIEHIFPGTGLHVYKVTEVITDDQLSLLVKLAKGYINTGYRQEEVDRALADIRAASVEACKTIFEVDGLVAKPENPAWPWFDLRDGDSRGFDSSGLYEESEKQFLAEFVIQHSDIGGDVFFKRRLLPEGAEKTPIKLAPGEMLVASRGPHHEFEITPIVDGVRFTLMTHVHP
jgi:hypothetical protein